MKIKKITKERYYTKSCKSMDKKLRVFFTSVEAGSVMVTTVSPYLLEEMGMAPARLRISSWTGVHWTQVMPSATRRLWISL